MKKLIVSALLALTSCNVSAALCITNTSDGQTAFLFKPDKTGKVTPTKYVFELVSNLTPCKVNPVTVRKEIVETYVIPNPQNACEKSAVLACDPSFGGLPVCTTNNFANFCGFCLLTTKVNEQDVTIRYINGQVYDGSKAVADSTAIACPNPDLLKTDLLTKIKGN